MRAQWGGWKMDGCQLRHCEQFRTFPLRYVLAHRAFASRSKDAKRVQGQGVEVLLARRVCSECCMSEERHSGQNEWDKRVGSCPGSASRTSFGWTCNDQTSSTTHLIRLDSRVAWILRVAHLQTTADVLLIESCSLHPTVWESIEPAREPSGSNPVFCDDFVVTTVYCAHGVVSYLLGKRCFSFTLPMEVSSGYPSRKARGEAGRDETSAKAAWQLGHE